MVYTRFSSDRQREESIEGQLRKCWEYASYKVIFPQVAYPSFLTGLPFTKEHSTADVTVERKVIPVSGCVDQRIAFLRRFFRRRKIIKRCNMARLAICGVGHDSRSGQEYIKSLHSGEERIII